MLLNAADSDCDEMTLKLAAHFGPVTDAALDAAVHRGEGIAGEVLLRAATRFWWKISIIRLRAAGTAPAGRPTSR